MGKGKAALYTLGAALAAPVVATLGLAGRIVAGLTVPLYRSAWQHPRRAALVIGLAGLVSYVACQDRERIALLPQRIATSAVVQHYRSRARTLEGHVEALTYENRRLETIAGDQESYIRSLEEELPPLTPPDAYYFVRPGETLLGIATRLTGSAGRYREIMKVNSILAPRTMPAGTLLRIPGRLLTEDAEGAYVRLPDLESVALEGRTRVSDAFPTEWRDVLRLNRSLGLDYKDKFQHVEGSRIVYYDPDKHKLNNTPQSSSHRGIPALAGGEGSARAVRGLHR